MCDKKSARRPEAQVTRARSLTFPRNVDRLPRNSAGYALELLPRRDQQRIARDEVASQLFSLPRYKRLLSCALKDSRRQ